MDDIAKIATLGQRLGELTDPQLADFTDSILVPRLAAAADERNVAAARELDRILGAARAEKRRRKIERQEADREIKDMLQRAGLVEEEVPPEPEPVAATLASMTPTISDLARHRRKQLSVRRSPVDPPSLWTTPAGRELASIAELADELRDRLRAQTIGRDGRFNIAPARWELGEDRTLGQDIEDNRAKLRAVVSPPALLASGGICAPPSPKFDFPGGSTGSRPLRDGLPRFDGSRGGIVYLPAPTIATATSAVGITTDAQDQTGENYPKPCLTVTCEDATELRVQAISRCLQFSNFNALTHPEAVTEYVDLTIAALARAAEDSLWAMMVAASTALTAGGTISATRELLAAVGRAAAQIRSRHRLPQDFTIRWGAPAWLIDLMQADMGYQAPGDSSMAITRADIESWLRARAVAPIWSLDAGQAFTAAQGAGPLTSWPSEVETILYPEGSFVHVDGGELDLGVVRDSTLNQTNDLQIFGEVFETVAFIGVESYALTLDLCASGLSAGHDDTVVCAS